MIKSLPQGWRVEKLGNEIICNLIMGQSPDSKSYNENNEGLPFFQGKKEFGKLYPIAEQYCSKPSKIALKDDILLSVRAPVGTVNMANLECCIGRGLAAIRVNKSQLLSKYLFFFIQKFENKFIEKSNGSTFEAITKKELEKIDIIVPPLPQQEKIVKVLDKSSSLVEQQKQLIEKYDLFLKSKFIEMFGDPITNPMGWEVKGLLDILSLTTGKLDSNASEENGVYPFFTCAQETFAINHYAFDCEALLLAGNNAAGIYSVKYYQGKFNAYQRTYILTLKNSKNNYKFFKFLLETKLEELKYKSIGTNTKYLTLGILKNINMYLPDSIVQNKFASIVEKIEAIKEKEIQKLNRLETLHASLMDKAFKGEIV